MSLKAEIALSCFLSLEEILMEENIGEKIRQILGPSK